MSWQEYFARDPGPFAAHPDVVVWVRAYYHGDARRGIGPSTGGFFDDLGHRGEPDPAPDQITPADLLALQMLDARIASAQIPWLLEDAEVGLLLAQIPVDARIWDDVLPEPWQLWDLLHDRHGLGETTTSKVLARKRPHLVPVVDEVVIASLGPTRPGLAWIWQGLRERLRDGDLRDRLTDVAIEADGPGLPLLRVLDVAIRMHHSCANIDEPDISQHALSIT